MVHDWMVVVWIKIDHEVQNLSTKVSWTFIEFPKGVEEWSYDGDVSIIAYIIGTRGQFYARVIKSYGALSGLK